MQCNVFVVTAIFAFCGLNAMFSAQQRPHLPGHEQDVQEMVLLGQQTTVQQLAEAGDPDENTAATTATQSSKCGDGQVTFYAFCSNRANARTLACMASSCCTGVSSYCWARADSATRCRATVATHATFMLLHDRGAMYFEATADLVAGGA